MQDAYSKSQQILLQIQLLKIKGGCVRTQFLEASTFRMGILVLTHPLEQQTICSLHFSSPLSILLLAEMIFLLIYLLLLLILLTFAAVKQLAMTYPANSAQQRNFDFFAFFSALYLVVSDILLTHTHRRYQRLIILFFFQPTRARSVS